MLTYMLKYFFPGGFFASDGLIDPGDVFGDFGVDTWFPCSSTTITPTNDTIEKTHFVTHTCQWSAGVSLKAHKNKQFYFFTLLWIVKFSFFTPLTLCYTSTNNEITK